MKKFIYSLATFFMVVLCSAQSSLTQAEYFWDTDPGVGMGTAVLATDGNFNSAFEQLTKTGITAPSIGLHKFCIRVKDNTGQWGPVFMNIIEVQGVATSPIMSILQAEFFWDTDPGLGLATPVLATDGSFNSAIEQLSKTGIALPTLGLHVFNIRVKDNTGQWGPLFRNVISVQTTLETPELNLSNLKVYPNPVKELLNISLDSSLITSVSVYNLLGQQLISKIINNNETGIDVSNLISGTYIVKINADNRVKTLKIIKE